MNEHKYLFVEPGRARRRRQQDMKELGKQPPGPQRAAAMAQLARALHENREINLALDAARTALDDAGGDAGPLLAAYATHDRPDLRIDDLSMLTSLARWLQADDLLVRARALALDEAVRWCATADGRERERRVDTLRRRFDDDLADQVDLAIS